MEPDEHEVEIFERIPWEALEKPADRRWALYLAAAALVMGAVGVTVGRGMVAPSAAPTSQPATSHPSTVGSSSPGTLVVPSSTVPVAAAPEIPTAWSEADLMALPAEALEQSAAVMAEWFVVDYFTRDGSDGSAEGRSFVEWAAVVDTTWRTASVVDLTVAVRRLAAEGDDAYRRMPVEGWLVAAELIDEGWVVVDGPVTAEIPEPATDLQPLGDDVPPEVAAEVDGAVRGGRDLDGRWLVEFDWTDDAGLTWVVRRWVEPAS